MPVISHLVLAASTNLDTWELIKNASGVVIGVMLLLAALSVISWFIIGYKFLFILRANNQSEQFLEVFWRSRDIQGIFTQAQQLNYSPLAHMFVAGYSELSKLQ